MTLENSVTALFVQQALASPQAVAVIDKEEYITYAALNTRAERIACLLRKKGVKRDVLVPIVLDNGIDIIAAILGILKAGGAFVPVDPYYPEERIAYILKDSQCRVIVSSPAFAGRLPQGDFDIVVPGTEQLPVTAEEQSLQYTFPDPASLAYVIYTSGSTGKPKGVMVEHRQLMAYLVDVVNRFDLAECNSYAILGTFAADAGYTAVFAALCYGKRLTVVNIKELSNFEQLAQRLAAAPVDCYKTTPSLMQLFLRHEQPQRLLPLKKLVLGGEACPWLLAKEVFQKLPGGCRLYNHYGPTETTIGVLTYTFPENINDFPDSIPLGTPLEHVTVHILSENLEAAATGELYIEGPLVARGYLDNPGLSNERFVMLNINGQRRRLYKTGDIVRMLPDGNIEYRGRSDEQVKILGNRIELQEIEQVVMTSGMVSRCAVVALHNDTGVPYLAGYITPGKAFDKAQLITFLKQQLPPWMVPYQWVILYEWPLTFNNKINKKALPAPEQPVMNDSNAGNDTGNRMEAALSGIWKRLLNIEAVKNTDHFFELGGNSLQLITLCFEISRRLHIEVTVVELFGYLTIQQQAAYLAGKQQEPEEDLAGFDEYAVTETQRNMFVQNLLNPSLSFPNASISFEIQGDIDLQKLEGAFKKVISDHESLRTAYYMLAGKVYKKISDSIDFRVQVVQAAGNNIDNAIISVTQPFNFRTLPLIRAFIIHLADERRFFHLDMPHINSDGESLKIIMQDIVETYNDVNDGRKRFQYSDFQKKLYSYLRSDRFREDEQFWQRQLLDDVPLPRFAAGTMRVGKGYEGAYRVFVLAEDVNEKVNSYINSSGFTRFQVFLCACCITIYRLTAVQDAFIMVPVHNRNEQGMNSVAGLLSNVVLVKSSIDPEETIRSYLTRSRNTILEILRRQRFPFEKQLEIWKTKGRDTRKLYSSFFGYHHHEDSYWAGKAELKLYIPSRSKENLPLSMAVFETSAGVTLRLSSTAGYYTDAELKAIAGLYSRVLQVIATGSGTDPVSVLPDMEYEINIIPQ